MQALNSPPFGMNFNFGTANLFLDQSVIPGGSTPPVTQYFELLDGTRMLLLDSTDFLLL